MDLHKGKLHDQCCSRNFIWLIKSIVMRWTERVEYMGEGKDHTVIGVQT